MINESIEYILVAAEIYFIVHFDNVHSFIFWYLLNNDHIIKL